MKIAILPNNVECCDGLRSGQATTKGPGTFVVVLPPDHAEMARNYTSTSASGRLGTWCTCASSRQ